MDVDNFRYMDRNTSVNKSINENLKIYEILDLQISASDEIGVLFVQREFSKVTFGNFSTLIKRTTDEKVDYYQIFLTIHEDCSDTDVRIKLTLKVIKLISFTTMM